MCIVICWRYFGIGFFSFIISIITNYSVSTCYSTITMKINVCIIIVVTIVTNTAVAGVVIVIAITTHITITSFSVDDVACCCNFL